MKPSAVSGPDANNRSRGLRARRLVLLATTIACLGAAALIVSPNFNLQGGYPTAFAQNLSEQARKMQAPVGFADIVEKVKPAVMSVRVKVDGGTETSGLGSNDVPPGLREFSVALECQMFRTGKKVCRADVAGTSLPAKVQASSFLRMATQ